MNDYLKKFINTCFFFSLLFLGLILSGYLFHFSIVLPALLSPIVFISLCVTLVCSLTFCVLISSKNLRELYFKNLIEFYDIVGNAFSSNFKLAIETDCIKNLYVDRQINFEQLKQINLKVRDGLDKSVIRELFINKNITFEQLNQIDLSTIYALEESNIRELFIMEYFSLEQINRLDWRKKASLKKALDSDNVRNLFKSGLITFEQLNQIDRDAIVILNDNGIRELFISHQLTFEQLNQLNYNAKDALQNSNIRELFISHQLTFEQLKQIDFKVRHTLDESNIRELFISHQLTFEQLNQLNYVEKNELQNSNIRELFINKSITFDQLSKLNFVARLALDDGNIRKLFQEKLITFAQLNQLNPKAIQALQDQDIRNSFIEGKLDLKDIQYQRESEDYFDSRYYQRESEDYFDFRYSIANQTTLLMKKIIIQFFDDRASLNLPNEGELMNLELLEPNEYISFIKDIATSSTSNPLLNNLYKQLTNYIKLKLDETFGTFLDQYFNESFTFEMFFDNFCSSRLIQSFLQAKINRYIEKNQAYKKSINVFSVFQQIQCRSSWIEHNYLKTNIIDNQ